MHIADGILPVEISIIADASALALVYVGGRNLESEEIPRMGVFAAALFIVSLIHFPIAGTSVHLGLYGFAGLLFGMRAIPIIFVNLLFQSLIFQHGGLLSIGINTLTMGSGALLSAAIWRWVKINRQIKSIFCGFLGILVPALLIALLFILANYGKGMLFMISVYLPTAAIEGALTLFIYNFFNKVKPEFFK
ncbi:MAG: cobalt transporter CbiM [bacterium]|nr:cobalt transporter CbiM [bacterium]